MSEKEKTFISEEEKKYTPVVEEHERFGAHVKEVLGGALDEYSLFTEMEDIEYETKEGQRFSIKELLPEGWRLLRKSRDVMEVNPENREIIYGDHYLLFREYTVPEGEALPKGIETERLTRRVNPGNRLVLEISSPPQITKKGFFLRLFHEFGHGHIFEEMSPEEQQILIHVRQELAFKKKSNFSQKEKELYNRFVVQDERKAWAWALRTIRRLRREGIDLAPELRSRGDILKGIHGALLTYEPGLDSKAHIEALNASRYLEEEEETETVNENLKRNLKPETEIRKATGT